MHSCTMSRKKRSAEKGERKMAEKTSNWKILRDREREREALWELRVKEEERERERERERVGEK